MKDKDQKKHRKENSEIMQGAGRQRQKAYS